MNVEDTYSAEEPEEITAANAKVTLLTEPSTTRRHGNFAGVHTLLRILLSIKTRKV
jgi:hypothetical protein